MIPTMIPPRWLAALVLPLMLGACNAENPMETSGKAPPQPEGKVEKTDITVNGDTLVLTNVSQPGMTMVLKRKAAK